MSEKSRAEPYPENDIEIIELGDSTSQFIRNFECDVGEIKKFLVEDALNQSREGVNRTFLWMSRETHQLLGYITICVDSIHLDKFQRDEEAKRGLPYKALPALKIARMGVQREFCRKGIGTKMISFAVKKALDINRIAACRFITLDAKSDVPENLKPIRFYKKNDFKELKYKKKEKSVPMFKDLVDIIKAEQKRI